MDSERRTEVTVGITVLLAILVLIVGVYWGKGARVLSSRQWLTVHFDDVRGLEVGDPVFVRGLKMGQVETIRLGSTFAEARIWILKEVALHSDLRISLENRELMGGVQVVLFPGESRVPADLTRVYRGEEQANLSVFVRRADHILQRADSLFADLHRFTDENRIETVLDEAGETMRVFQSAVSENREHIRNTLARLDAMTLRFEEQSFPTRLSALVTHLDSTTSLLHTLALRIEAEEGTVGKLLRDRWLYDQLLKTSVDLDSLITDLKTHPKKYVRFSLF